MSQASTEVERSMRIELLRAKAALEREALAASFQHTPHTPAQPALPGIHDLVPGLLGAVRLPGGTSQMVLQAYQFWRQYPVVGSVVSAVVLRGSRRSRVIKTALTAAAAWKAYQLWRDSQDDHADVDYADQD